MYPRGLDAVFSLKSDRETKRMFRCPDPAIPCYFPPEKELTDQTLKLAEVGKPKSIWELQRLLGFAAFVLGFLVGE